MVDVELLARVDARAAVLGQTRRVFVERALVLALRTDDVTRRIVEEESSAPAEQLRDGPLVDEIVAEHPEVVGRESIIPLKAGERPVVPSTLTEVEMEFDDRVLFHCPVPGCDFAAPSDKASCGRHGRRVR